MAKGSVVFVLIRTIVILYQPDRTSRSQDLRQN